MSIHGQDLLWLAGLLEGDGCFLESKSKPRITLQMVDEDVIQRVADIWQCGYSSYSPRKSNWSALHTVLISSQRAINWMEAISPYMGSRRQSKISDLIARYEKKKNIFRGGHAHNGLLAEEILCRTTLLAELKKHSYRELAKKYGFSHETIRRAALNLNRKGMPKSGPSKALSDGEALSFWVNETTNLTNLPWLAGLLEAEGSFLKGPPSRPGSPVISIQMTDRDVIDRVRDFMAPDYKVYHCYKSQRELGHKDVFAFSMRGKRAYHFMLQLRPFMGIRRQEQITRALTCYTPDGTRVAAKKRADNMRTMTDTQVMEMWKYRQKGATLRDLGTSYGVDKETIRYAIKNLVPRILASTRKRPPKSTGAIVTDSQ